MTDVKVEQCDRDAAANLFCDWCHVVPHSSIPKNMRCGNMDEHQFVYAFARHRQAAEKAQQERDAGIADAHRQARLEAAKNALARKDKSEARDHESMAIEALHIATAIRSQGHE